MLPKILHYCWFGGSQPPHEEFRRQWRKLHPQWIIYGWDETNAPIQHPYLAAVLATQSYSKAADFMRLWTLVEFGGIYLDTDVECLSSFEPFRDRQCFAGFQSDELTDPPEFVNTAVFGAEYGHWVPRTLFQRLLAIDDGSQIPPESGPRLISRFLYSHGVRPHPAESGDPPREVKLFDAQTGSMSIFSRATFYPFRWTEQFTPSCITEQTVAIHHWDGSWTEHWKSGRPRPPIHPP